MNEGMFLALRNYLEELTAQNRQIIGLLEQIAGAKIQPATVPDAFMEAVKQLATKPSIPSAAIGPVTVETVKEEPLKTTETVEVVQPKTATKKRR